MGAAGEPHLVDMFWNSKTNTPIIPEKGSLEYKRQSAIRSIWGKSKPLHQEPHSLPE